MQSTRSLIVHAGSLFQRCKFDFWGRGSTINSSHKGMLTRTWRCSFHVPASELDDLIMNKEQVRLGGVQRQKVNAAALACSCSSLSLVLCPAPALLARPPAFCDLQSRTKNTVVQRLLHVAQLASCGLVRITSNVMKQAL